MSVKKAAQIVSVLVLGSAISSCSGTGSGNAVPIGGIPTSVTTTTYNLSYAVPSATYVSGNAITANTATFNGVAPVSFAIMPALPAGLSLDALTGTISGTPTAVSALTNYTVTATHLEGSVTAVIGIAVNDALPVVTYPVVAPTVISFTLNSGTGLPINPVASGGALTSCSISPALPAGLSISPTTCAISGTPTALSSSTTYTITPSSLGGSGATSQIILRVQDVAPGIITYSTPNPTYVRTTAIAANTPNVVGGGTIISWAISPNLNSNTGLSFDTGTGIISGTPTLVSQPGVVYTITATNTGGSASVNMTLTVNDLAPTLSYAGPFSYQAGTAVSPVISATLGGGTPTNCVASPALPAGFILNATTCAISGTPTGIAPAQDYTITAVNSGGSAAATVNLAVTAAPPGNIALTGSTSFTTATCSAFTLTVRDSFGNPSAVSSDTFFDLAGAGTGGAFYSDSMCTTTTTSVSVPNGSASVVYYYRKASSGATTLNATLNNPVTPALGSATRNVNVTPSTPARYGIVAPTTATTVDCNLVTINVLDSNSNSVNAISALTVNLSASGGATTYFSDSGCTATVTNRSIGIGSSSAIAYFRKTTTGATTLTAASAGMASGTAAMTITLAPAARIVFNAPPASPYAATTCQTYVIQTRDALGNNNPAVTANTTVTLSGVSDGSFYSAAGCTGGTEITSTTINSGTATRTIYFRKPTASAVTPGSNITLTASVAGWTPNATATVSVSSGTQINIATTDAAAGIAISSATNIAAASRCLATTVRIRDELNVMVPTANITAPITANLSGGGAGAQFWSNSSCTTPTATVTVNAGANTAQFWYSSTSTTGGAVPISWDNGGLGGSGGSRNVTVTDGVPSRLVWNANPATFLANTCQTYSFFVRDPNTVTQLNAGVSSPTVFSLADGSDGIFYSGAGCVGSTSTITVNTAASAGTFYYRKLTSTPPAATIAVSLNSPASPVITGLTRTLTVNLTPDNILISVSPSAGLIATQSCSAVTVTSRNGTTNTNVSANTTVTLTASNGGTFYYDSNCTAAASPNTLMIASGSNNTTGLYVRTANTGTVNVNGTATGLTVNGVALSYAAPVPTQLSLSGPILLNAGSSCGLYTVTTQDAGSIARAVSSNTTITVSSTGTDPVQFFSNASCTTALPSNEVTVTSGTSTASFYTSGAVVGNAQISVSGGALTADSQNVTIQ